MHYTSLDKVRYALIILNVIVCYFHFSRLVDLALVFMNFAPCVLFAIYGYFVLRDGRDLRKDIRKTGTFFLVLMLVYLAISILPVIAAGGSIAPFISKRFIFNAAVLNIWGLRLGNSLWLIQATVYSLIICYLLRKYNEYAYIMAGGCFALGAIVGEFAAIWHMHILGYLYIPGNFLTRALPYMLIGHYIWKYNSKIDKLSNTFFINAIALGLIISIGEFMVLNSFEKLIYYNHFLGFILVSSGIAGLAIKNRSTSPVGLLNRVSGTAFRFTYASYNPLCEIIFLAALFSSATLGELFWKVLTSPYFSLVIALVAAILWVAKKDQLEGDTYLQSLRKLWSRDNVLSTSVVVDMEKGIPGNADGQPGQGDYRASLDKAEQAQKQADYAAVADARKEAEAQRYGSVDTAELAQEQAEAKAKREEAAAASRMQNADKYAVDTEAIQADKASLTADKEAKAQALDARYGAEAAKNAGYSKHEDRLDTWDKHMKRHLK